MTYWRNILSSKTCVPSSISGSTGFQVLASRLASVGLVSKGVGGVMDGRQTPSECLDYSGLSLEANASALIAYTSP